MLGDTVLLEKEAARAEREAAGYCVHNMYVGGLGRDLICGPCEDGATVPVEYDVHVIFIGDHELDRDSSFDRLVAKYDPLMEHATTHDITIHTRREVRWCTVEEAREIERMDHNARMEALTDSGITFDYAVPQPWLDDIIERADIDYILGWCWIYPSEHSAFGLPYPRTSWAARVLDKLDVRYHIIEGVTG